MRLDGVRVEDIVECNIRERRFYAKVEEKERGGLAVKPITPNVTFRHVTSQQVVAHYRRRT